MMYYSKIAKGFYDGALFEDLPLDAVEVATDDYKSILQGASQGLVITCNKDGYPVLSDAPTPTTEELAAIARGERDTLLMETDYLVMQDYPHSAASLAAIKEYRQALRDVPAQPRFPNGIEWPVRL
jgi:hypothetical protein